MIKQLRTGIDNFSYIISSKTTSTAAVVDPGLNAKPTIDFLQQQNLTVKYIIATHYHSDHIANIKTLKKHYPHAHIIASAQDGKYLTPSPNHFVADNEKIKFDNVELLFLHTPGHTPGSICIVVNQEAIITGDTLFIGDCGRIDLPGGNLKQMYQTLQEKIMNLSDSLIIYPGHDYGNKPYDLLGNQKPLFSSYFKDVMHLL